MAAANIVTTFLQTGEPPNCVNLRPADSGSPHGLVVRHADRVGVLAGVFDVLKRHNYNIQEIENRIFAGKLAACAKISLERAPNEALMKELAECQGVFHASSVGS